MNFLKKNLEKHLPYLKEAIEDRLDVDLGEIDVSPFSRWLDDHLSRSSYNITKTGERLVRITIKPFSLLMELFFIPFKLGNSTIYYSRSPLYLLYNENDVIQSGLHELAHIANAKIANKRNIEEIKENVSEFVYEGFAELVARNVMEDSGLKTMKPFKSDNIWHYKKFIQNLPVTDLRDYDAIKHHLLSFYAKQFK
jgi:hypothetical protein